MKWPGGGYFYHMRSDLLREQWQGEMLQTSNWLEKRIFQLTSDLDLFHGKARPQLRWRGNTKPVRLPQIQLCGGKKLDLWLLRQMRKKKKHQVYNVLLSLRAHLYVIELKSFIRICIMHVFRRWILYHTKSLQKKKTNFHHKDVLLIWRLSNAHVFSCQQVMPTATMPKEDSHLMETLNPRGPPVVTLTSQTMFSD